MTLFNTKGLTEAMKQLTKPMDGLAEFVKQATKPIDELAAAMKPYFEQLHQQQKALHDALIAPLQAAFAPIQEAARRHHEKLNATMAPFIEAIRRENEVRPGVLNYLLERGWYFNYHFPVFLFIRFHEFIRDGNHDEVDATMSELARTQLEDTEKKLRQRFPDRSQMFADAFEAHRVGKYTLSIPVLLAQSDGVGCEVLGGIPRQFFRDRSRREALQQILSAFTLFGEPYSLGGVMGEMLDPLTADSSFSVATEKRDNRRNNTPWFGPLNRHGVLHGLDTDYWTEANSLRCVLLLRYLLDVDQILRKDIPERVAELNATWERALLSLSPAARKLAEAERT